MQFFEVIECLAVQLRLPQLVPGTQGVCALRIDAMVFTFAHEPMARAFEVSTPLGHADLQDPMTVQWLQAGAQAEAIRLRWDHTGLTTQFQRFSLPHLSFPPFFRALEHFINQAERTRRRLT